MTKHEQERVANNIIKKQKRILRKYINYHTHYYGEKALNLAAFTFSDKTNVYIMLGENALNLAAFTFAKNEVRSIIRNCPSLPIEGEWDNYYQDIKLSTKWWNDVLLQIHKQERIYKKKNK